MDKKLVPDYVVKLNDLFYAKKERILEEPD